MIVVESALVSAISESRDRPLGKITIANVGGTVRRGEYVATLYSAGKTPRFVRQVVIHDWPRLANTAQALVAEAYKRLFPN